MSTGTQRLGHWLDIEPFWQGVARDELMLPYCPRCRTFGAPTRAHCVNDFNTDIEWRKAGGWGTVYASTVIRQYGGELFQPLLPYAVGLVDLDEGPRLMSMIEAPRPEAVQPGCRVEAVFREHGGRKVLRFRLVE